VTAELAGLKQPSVPSSAPCHFKIRGAVLTHFGYLSFLPLVRCQVQWSANGCFTFQTASV